MSYPAFLPQHFSLRLNYRKTNYPGIEVPGFYLDAGFADEGSARPIYEARLVKAKSLLAIAREVDIQLVGEDTIAWPGLMSGREDGPLTERLRPIAEAGRQVMLSERKSALEDIERQKKRLATIDEALRNG